MKIHVFQCVCDICGGPGMTTSRGLTAAWTGGFVRHNDPRVCQGHIREREAKLKSQIAASSSSNKEQEGGENV